MPTGITCPACGAELPAVPDDACDSVPCPRCGASVPIPLTDPDPTPEPPARERKK